MRDRLAIFVGVILLGGIVAAAAQMGGMMGQGGMGQGGMGQGRGMHGGMMGSQRHFIYMHRALPKAYAGKSNPLLSTPAVLAEGRKLYTSDCAVCHGAEGHGDGPQAATLNPAPADLAFTLSRPIGRDDFLYWTIAEGGAPVGSAMPAFKSALKPHEIWAIVTALRSGELKPK